MSILRKHTWHSSNIEGSSTQITHHRTHHSYHPLGPFSHFELFCPLFTFTKEFLLFAHYKTTLFLSKSLAINSRQQRQLCPTPSPKYTLNTLVVWWWSRTFPESLLVGRGRVMAIRSPSRPTWNWNRRLEEIAAYRVRRSQLIYQDEIDGKNNTELDNTYNSCMWKVSVCVCVCSHRCVSNTVLMISEVRLRPPNLNSLVLRAHSNWDMRLEGAENQLRVIFKSRRSMSKWGTFNSL